MQPISVSSVTPNQKIIGVNTRFGNKGIQKQQGTTRVIYDTLTLDTTANTFRFFEGVNTRTFPDTNVGQSGNGLQVGESLSIDRMHIGFVTFDIGLPSYLDVVSLADGGRVDVEAGDISIKIANTIVLKPIPLSSFNSLFNKSSKFADDAHFDFDTSLILPPLLEFVVEVRRIGVNVALANAALRLTIEGVGSILAPRTTY